MAVVGGDRKFTSHVYAGVLCAVNLDLKLLRTTHSAVTRTGAAKGAKSGFKELGQPLYCCVRGPV